MRPRQPDLRKVKIHRNYTIEEVATLLGVHRHTVRSWIKSGLPAIDDRRPILILGNQLQDFHRKRRDQNKRPCAPGELYCMRCREPRKPVGLAVRYAPLTATNGNLIGHCVDCNLRMYRRINFGKLDLIKGGLAVTVTEGQEHMYEQLLASGRPGPQVVEGDDRVTVTVARRVAHPEIIELIAKADSAFQLMPRERITLGLIAQHESMTAIQLGKALSLKGAEAVQHWLGRLLDFDLVLTQGRTKGTTYLVNPEVLKAAQFRGRTSLKGIERHRLRELVVRDLGIYGRSKRGAIHSRIGAEIPERALRSELAAMVGDGVLTAFGIKGGRQYELTESR